MQAEGTGMTPRETTVRATFIEVRRLATAVEKGDLSISKVNKSRREFVSLVLKHGPAELLKYLTFRVGTFYRTTDSNLLFFRDADHRLYDIEEKTFERYLIQLTDNVTGLRQQWLPRLQAWVRFNAAEVTTHFLGYNDGPDLNVIAVNTFDGHMMLRKRGENWKRVPNGTDGVLFLTPPEFLSP